MRECDTFKGIETKAEKFTFFFVLFLKNALTILTGSAINNMLALED